VDYESETTSKSSESEWETKSESDSDTEFRNLVDTPSANYVRTPRQGETSAENFNSGGIAPLEEDDDEEDFVSGQGWSLPSPGAAWEAKDNCDNEISRITPDAVQECAEPSLQNPRALKMMGSRVSPESVILTGESSCVSGQCQISSQVPRKTSFQALGTFLSSPFRIILNYFRKSEPYDKL